MGDTSESAQRLFQKAYKYRIYPNAEQERFFRMTIGCCRYVYNHFLEARIKAYERTCRTLRRQVVDENGEPVLDEKEKPVWEEVANEDYDPAAKPLSYFDTSKMLTALKKEVMDESGHRWLNDADAVALVYSLRHLENAYKNFFRRVKTGGEPGFPKFKGKQAAGSYKTAMKTADPVIPGRNGSKNGYIKLPKSGPVRAKIDRMPEGTPVSAAVSVDTAGRWFCSIACKDVEIAAAEPLEDLVGVTTGISQWAVTSDGEVFDNPRRARAMKKRLEREERRLSRRVGAKKGEKASNRYLKQKVKVARLKARLADQRRDDTHKLTRALVDEHGGIAIRQQKVKEMQHGDAVESGAAQRRINAALADANLAEIERQLAYKAEWAGRTFILVDGDYPTAQTCGACGHKHTVLARDLRPTWTCPECGAVHDRKANGAANVLAAARDILAGKPVAPVSKNRPEKKVRKRKAAKADKAVVEQKA